MFNFFNFNVLNYELLLSLFVTSYLFLFPTKLGVSNIRILVLIYSAIMQFLSFYSYFFFDCFILPNSSNYGFQYFTQFFNFSDSGIQLVFGVDGFSLGFIILSIFIFNICFFSVDQNAKEFMLFIQLLLILEVLILLIFSVLDLFFFYFFF